MSNSLWPLDCHQPSLSLIMPQSSPKFMSIESVMPFNHLILCCPLLLLPSIFPSIRVFSNELALHIKWEKIRAPASASVFPMNIQGWFPLGLAGLISLQSEGFSRVFSSTTIQRHQFSGAQLSLWSNSHIHTWKTIAERVIERSQSLSCHHSSKAEGSCLSLMVSNEKSLGFLVVGGPYLWIEYACW